MWNVEFVDTYNWRNLQQTFPSHVLQNMEIIVPVDVILKIIAKLFSMYKIFVLFYFIFHD